MTFAEHARRNFDYEKASYRALFAQLETLAPRHGTRAEYQQILDHLAHLAVARLFWLFRMGVRAESPEGFFPNGLPLAAVKQRITGMEAEWDAYLARLDEGETERVIAYRSTEGPSYENTVHEILTQLFGHSIHHRAQMAQLFRALGEEPPLADFIFWARRKV